jgi:para-aminobenzoate synthetase component 1
VSRWERLARIEAAAYLAAMTSRASVLCEPIPPGEPLASAAALASLPYPFLLHSSAQGGRARWSFFGADPFAVFGPGDYDQARQVWRSFSGPRASGIPELEAIPFTGGAVGYWAYDFGRRLERLPSLAADDLGLPDVLLALYDVVGAYDHEQRRGFAISSGLPLTGTAGTTRAAARLRWFAGVLAAPDRGNAKLPPRREAIAHPVSTFTADDYRAGVQRVKDLIAAGDLFQANLSQRWTLPVTPASPVRRALALAGSLARHSPAPHAAFFAAPDHALASASPERFLELRGRRVETRPIKGTRPRSADASEDRRLADELEASPKDRAENAMIVDVLRNDLGRVCETGSVGVAALCELETFPQVFHLTSTVTGTLAPGRDAFDLLHACFPGGSITGAPKIRAMEVLERLEPVRRHLYTGSIGYLDWNGDADWSIAIRTLTVTEDAVRFSAGGGITADSDPGAEYRETLDKAEGMRLALEPVEGPVALAPVPAGRR